MAQYIPFLDNANLLFQKRFCFSRTSAGEVVTITYIATAVISGPLGLVVNKVGKRRFFIMTATLVFLSAHTIIWLFSQCSIEAEYSPVWGLFLLGIGYSFYANVIVASIPLVVKKKILGSAIAIMEILSSLTECVVPILTGYLIESEENENGYKLSSFFFFLLGTFGLFSSIFLLFIEARMKRRLDKGETRRVVDVEDISEVLLPSSYNRIEEPGEEVKRREEVGNGSKAKGTRTIEL